MDKQFIILAAISVAGVALLSGYTGVMPPESDNSAEGIFVEKSTEANLSYVESGSTTVEGEISAGVYVSDYNNNGYSDVLLIGGDYPIFFKNIGGEFVRHSEFPGYDDSYTAIFFDYNNDNYDDLYLLSDSGSTFFKNNGTGFERQEVGLEVEYDSVRGASAADYTGNGCLDLFIVQAGDWRENRPAGFDDINVSINEDNGNENRLFRGDCEKFEEVTDEAGIEGEAWSLATSFVDLTNDGYPDIHVANDFNNDVLYLNQQNGTFERRVLPEFTNRNGMSSEVADVTGNGYLDIFVSNIYSESGESKGGVEGRTEGNNLLINIGDTGLNDNATEYGVKESGWGWSAVFEDFTNNAELDLFQTTWTTEGYESASRSSTSYFWKNKSNNKTFEHIEAEEAGLIETHSLGVASIDYNRNGRMDIIESSLNRTLNSGAEGYRLYENKLMEGNFLQIDIEGSQQQTGLGTRVNVQTKNESQTRIKSSGTDYQSQGTRTLHFGIGEEDVIKQVRIEWPDAEVQEFNEVEPNQRIRVSKGTDGFEKVQGDKPGRDDVTGINTHHRDKVANENGEQEGIENATEEEIMDAILDELDEEERDVLTPDNSG